MYKTTVILKKGEGRTLKAGGLWVFDNEIAKIDGKFENGDIISMASMSAALLPQEAALLASVLQKPEALRNGDKALADYIERIKNRHELKQSGGDLRQLANRLKETKGYEG